MHYSKKQQVIDPCFGAHINLLLVFIFLLKKCRYFEFCFEINLNHGFIQSHDLPFYFAFLFLFLFSDEPQHYTKLE